MTSNRIRARLDQLELEQYRAELEDAEYHDRMYRQLQAETGLPLPSGIPDGVMAEGLRRIIALQAAIRIDRNDEQACNDFCEWVASIHKKYGDDDAKR